MASRLFVSGDASMASRLFVGGDASMASRLFVGGDASMSSNLYVNKQFSCLGNALVYSNLTVTGNTTTNYNLFVNGDISVTGALNFNWRPGSIPSSAIVDNLNTIQNQTINGDKTFNGIINSSVVTFPDNSVISANSPNLDNSLFFYSSPNVNTLNSYNLPGSVTIISNAISENGKYVLLGSVINNSALYLSTNYGLSGSFQNVNPSFTYQWYSLAVSATGRYQAALAYQSNNFVNMFLSTNYGSLGSWVGVSPASNVAFTSVPGSSFSCNSSVSISANGQYQSFILNSMVYISTNYGSIGSWSVPITAASPFSSCVVSPNGKYFIAASTPKLYISSSYGATGSWTAIGAVYPSSQYNVTSIATSTNAQYQTVTLSPGAIFVSTNYGITGSWQNVYSSLGTTSIKSINHVSMNYTGQYQALNTTDNTIYTSTNYGAVGSWSLNNSLSNNNTLTTNLSAISVSTNGQYLVFTPVVGTNYIVSVTPITSLNLGSGGLLSYGPINAIGGLTVTGTLSLNNDLFVTGNLYVSNTVTAKTYRYSSDVRIKKNITTLDETFALDVIRNIQPRMFNYIENGEHLGGHTGSVCGFIAQEIKQVVDFPVSLSVDFIPSIFDYATVGFDGLSVYLHNVQTANLYTGDRVKFLGINDMVIIRTVANVLNTYEFTLSEPIRDVLNNQVFVYGKEVNDFHSVDPNSISTISTAAIKKIDRELQDMKETVRKQDLEIAELKQQVGILVKLLM